MESLAVQRTPAIIAAEINSIKNQTMQMVLCNSIEIGNRLIEAKSMLEHGEWGKWLETSVNYSQRTANNLMRVAEEYGADQYALFGANAKSQALANLSYTQAVALLGVPEEEREAFVSEHDVANMSTRELQQAIKERDEALKKLEEVTEERETYHIKADTYSKHLESFENINKQHCEEVERLKKQLAEAQASGNAEEIMRLQEQCNMAVAELKSSNIKIAELERQLKKKPIDIPATIEKVPEAIEQELAELRKSSDPGIVKFKVVFDDLVKRFQDLLTTLESIKDPETRDKYKDAVSGLIEKMQEKL